MAERILEGKTVLVTGGAGFIGSNFIHYLLKTYSDLKIINLDKLTYAGNLENLRDIEDDPRYEFVHADIRDRKTVERLFSQVQAVVHMAAETHVDRSIMDAGEFVLTDVYGSFILFEALKDSEIEIFLHISTDEVYGSRDEGFFREIDPLNPSSPYAASKAGADRLAYSYVVTYGLPIVILRPSNNYGPYQYPEKFIPLFVTNALENKLLPLYGRGTNVRDWLHVEDNCEAIELVMRRGEPGQVYNVGANAEVRNIEVAERIVQVLGKTPDLIKYVQDRLGHDRRYALDCSKIHALGWKPTWDFSEGLDSTIYWYKENPEWWHKIKYQSEDFKKFHKEYYKERE
ncbi:MAG: dTDP-glucose 4,6-dehydratase [Candidatus Aminicenantes bacterium]|nr:dTDP-glucose 4,6-dehydratase [Candidatus Aminicenantes bacterium]